ncbi:MAG: alkane 1-monooxygenase [Myxococcota bacterium]
MSGAVPFGLVYVIPLTLVLGLVWGGAWTFSTAILIFVITPVLDAIIGLREDPPDADDRGAWLYESWIVLWPPVQIALMIAVFWAIAIKGTSPLETAGLLLSLGILSGGGGINIAHEFMHRSSLFARGTAEVLMTLATYPHFCVEHILGHHRNVATPLDPASARRGESVYPFLLRTIWGGLRSAWRLEGQRVAKRNLRPFGWQDRRLRHPLLVLGLYGATFWAFGTVGVMALFVQSAIAVGLLEVINYVEHYGLQRTQTPNGRFERVQPKHSWNSAHRLSGWYLFNLPRHADHHYEARRTYRELRHLQDSPQLPMGYPTMVLMALVPPLWFWVMNGRVDAWNGAQSEHSSAASEAVAAT